MYFYFAVILQQKVLRKKQVLMVKFIILQPYKHGKCLVFFKQIIYIYIYKNQRNFKVHRVLYCDPFNWIKISYYAHCTRPLLTRPADQEAWMTILLT